MEACGAAAALVAPFPASTSTSSSQATSLCVVSRPNRVWRSLHFDAARRKSWALVCKASFSGAGALTPELKESFDKLVNKQKVVLFMKGTKLFPQCGFSNTVVQILNSLNVPFETVNILENDALRQGLKIYSNWPTFPQLYIDGEFFGGCDITLDAYQSGQLKEVIEKAMCS